MERSFARNFVVECVECGERVGVDVWLVVDGSARPDLIERIRDGTIHHSMCSRHHITRIGAPLLVLDRAGQRLIFTPAQEGRDDKARAELTNLVATLEERSIGEDIPTRIDTVPRSYLAMALDGRTVQEITRLVEALDRLREAQHVADERFVQRCRDVLAVLRREDNPAMWAALHNDLAAGLVMSRDRTPRCVDEAIKAAETALSVFTRQDFPRDFARSHVVMALAYMARNNLNRPPAPEEVIQLLSRGPGTKPTPTLDDIADTFHALGKELWGQGELQGARDSFARASQLCREAGGDDDLAFVLHDLAKVQIDLEDLSAARQTYSETVDIFQRLVSRHPEDRRYGLELAQALRGLAVCELSLAGESPSAEVLARCRDLVQRWVTSFQALSPADISDDDGYDDHAADLALALGQIGRFHERLHELDLARRCYSEALELLERGPGDVGVSRLEVKADINFALGLLNLDKLAIKEAYANFTAAVVGYTNLNDKQSGSHVESLIAALDALGRVSDDLGDEERARACLERAAALHETRSVDALASPKALLWRASSLVNLAHILRKLKDVDGAIRHAVDALELVRQHGDSTSEASAELMATVCITLGGLMSEKGRHDLGDNLLWEAVDIYRRLTRRSTTHLGALAIALGNLGASRLVQGDRQAARLHLQESLVIRRLRADIDPSRFTLDVASALTTLALSESMDNPTAAEERYLEAIEIWTAANTSSPFMRTYELFAAWNNLSNLYLPRSGSSQREDPEKGYHALQRAVHYAEASRGRFFDRVQRRRVLDQALPKYDELIHLCVERSRSHDTLACLREAVEVSEASRARILNEIILDDVPRSATAPTDLMDEFDAVRRQLHESETLLFYEEHPGRLTTETGDGAPSYVVSTTAHWPSEIKTVRAASTASDDATMSRLRKERLTARLARTKQLRRQYETALETIRRYDKDFDPDRAFQPASFDEIVRTIPRDCSTALIEFFVGEERGYAFVIRDDGIEVATLPQLTHEHVSDLARSWIDARTRTRVADEWRLARARERQREWEAHVDIHLARLARMLRPLRDALSSMRLSRLIVSPHRALHVFPLHACPYDEANGFVDAFEIVYTPSLSIQCACGRRKRATAGDVMLVHDSTGDIPFSQLESACVLSHHPGAQRFDTRKTQRDELLHRLRSARLLHYAGHGLFDARDPLSSALIPDDAPDGTLTVRDLLGHVQMTGNELSVLSGCETGVLNPDVMDESLSLALAFLCIGARSVVSSMWEIQDLSAALLLDRFHAEWSSGTMAAAALRTAQRWLRDIPSGEHLRRDILPRVLSTVKDSALRDSCRQSAERHCDEHPATPPFRSPLHWAPFYCAGVGYPLTSDTSQSH